MRERYKCLDGFLSDATWNAPDGRDDRLLATIRYELWQAVKAALGEVDR